MRTLAFASCVRGYHVYKDLWIPVTNEELACRREPGNVHDPYAVAVTKSGIVGHVPRKMSALCSLFLRKGGTITCSITGPRQYSADLVQGGMEVPCIYYFRGEDADVGKVEKLLQLSNAPISNEHHDIESEQEPKRVKVDVDLDEPQRQDDCAENDVWVTCGDNTLSVEDKSSLRKGDDLNDKHINFGQCLIKRQFPNIHGLKSTLTITKRAYSYLDMECQGPFIQVIHTGNHWVVASNIGGVKDEVTVYDSLYKVVDKGTHDLLKRLFKNVKIKVFLLQPQLQAGIHDCGVFALAFCTSLAMGEDLSDVKFNQDVMRKHLEACCDKKHLSTFPKL